MKYYNYNERLYPFQQVVQQIFGIELETLHLGSEPYEELFEVGKDSNTVFHQAFYDKYRAGWPALEFTYMAFIRNFIRPMFPESILFQKFPTFRVHLPLNVAVGRFHNDSEFGHPKGEINFILPLTPSRGSASVWMESQAGKQDYRSMEMVPGQLIEFNGNELSHGNNPNQSGYTRVSMDFRILPISKYNPSEEVSITTHTKFVEGEYYKLLK